ncbi:MAG: DNA-binding response regulator [Verrucomicrobiales bacterium]|nr:DNA-binding response regulator [Verrucomicrobiales bacterium]
MKRILVIEDQPRMLKNIALILEMEGYEVIRAENGRAGLERIRIRLPDLVICDVMMPELDGRGVLQALRGEPGTATLPFIFLTANGDQSDIRQGMNLGADDYLTKPVSRADLLAAVTTRLARRLAHQSEIEAVQAGGGFLPDFSSPAPLLSLGLTAREAEVLLWVAQGKANSDVGQVLGMAEKTVKKHLGSIFDKLGVENRSAASLLALEKLSGGHS